MYSKAFAGRDICAARLRAWSSRHFCSCRSICAGPCGQFGILCFKMRLGGLFECNLWSLCSFGFLEGFSLVIDRSIFIECFGMALDCPVRQVGVVFALKVFLCWKCWSQVLKFFLFMFGVFWVILVCVFLALVLKSSENRRPSMMFGRPWFLNQEAWLKSWSISSRFFF